MPGGLGPVNFVPDGLIEGGASATENVTGHKASDSMLDAAEASLALLHTSVAPRGPSRGRGGGPPAANTPPAFARAGRPGRADASVPQLAGDGSGGDDCGRMPGRTFHQVDDTQGGQSGPRGPLPARDRKGGGLHDLAGLGRRRLAYHGGINEIGQEVDCPVLGAEACRGCSGQSGNAGLQFGDGSRPSGGPHAVPSSSGPPGPDALEECRSNPQGYSEVRGARRDDPGPEGREGERSTPELDARGTDNGGLDGASAGDAHDSRAGRPAGPQGRGEDRKGEDPRDTNDSVDARVRSRPTNKDGQDMQNLGDTVAQQPGCALSWSWRHR